MVELDLSESTDLAIFIVTASCLVKRTLDTQIISRLAVFCLPRFPKFTPKQRRVASYTLFEVRLETEPVGASLPSTAEAIGGQICFEVDINRENTQALLSTGLKWRKAASRLAEQLDVRDEGIRSVIKAIFVSYHECRSGLLPEAAKPEVSH